MLNRLRHLAALAFIGAAAIPAVACVLDSGAYPAGPLACDTISGLHVAVNGGEHTYEFIAHCNPGDFAIDGTYSPASNTASGQNGGTLSTCIGDPWALNAPCLRTDIWGEPPGASSLFAYQFPVSAWYMTSSQRAMVNAALADAEAGAVRLPIIPLPGGLSGGTPTPQPGLNCTTPPQIGVQVVAPAAMASFSGGVLFHATRANAQCSNTRNVFELNVQVYKSIFGVWQPAPVLTKLDEVAHPGGMTAAHSAFVAYGANGQFNQFRVQVRLTGVANAPWSGFTRFYVN